VVAARLSEDADARVLLLEAGSGQALEAMAVPSAWMTLRGSSADWGDSTAVDPVLQRSVTWPRGRGLGGSSSINAMMFARGHRSGYDAWAADGAKGWGFDDLLPFFRRSENAQGRDPAVRGTDGPMVVAPVAPPHPAASAYLEAAAEAGYPGASDISSGLEEGFGRPDLNIAGGRRLSAADAYLRPVMGRPNLEVVTSALVHRVRVSGERCTGIDYTVNGRVVQADCSREVVLCAGTVGSAQLMLLSGIGPASHLREVGIDIVADLPGVGANLHDHPQSVIVYAPAQPVPMGVVPGQAIGLVRSDPSLAAPDLQFLGVTPAPLEAGAAIVIAFSVMTPRSRGQLRLASKDPATAPVLDPRYLSDSRDFDVFVAGLNAARQIGQASPLAAWCGEEVVPGPGVSDENSLRAFLRASLESYYHYVGTCRIGADEMAVVDTDLRVRGIAGLRIADASVMPSIPSANTQPTVLAIAERAAALIRSA
jgi:choline dehydrogenase